MESMEFDTLAVASDLQAAGIQAAHAQAIVSAVNQATGRLVSQGRFDAAIAELRHELKTGLDRQAAAMESALANHAAAMESALANHAAAQAAAVTKLRHDMEVGLAKQSAEFAEAKAEIYRYLWVMGGILVAVLSTLYMLAETWSRSLI